MFINRLREIDEIVTRIKFKTQCSAISGDFGTGKSALLKHIADPHTMQQYQIPEDQFILLYFPCPQIANVPDYTPQTFWQHIFQELNSKIQNPELKKILDTFLISKDFDYYQVESLFYDAKARQDLSIVLLLDDFDNLLASPNFTEEFLWSLKNLANNHIDYNFGMVTATSPRLSQLCYNPKLLTSPFFNIFSNIDLKPFEENDGLDFIRHQQQQLKVEPAFDDISQMKLYRISGGIPFILELLCEQIQSPSVIQNFYNSQLLSWDPTRIHILQNYIQLFWKNSASNEKKMILYLALILFIEKFQRLDNDSLKNIKNEFINDWPALVRRGWINQDQLIVYLFPQSFVKTILNEVFTVPEQVMSLSNLSLSTKSDLILVKNYLKPLYQNLF